MRRILFFPLLILVFSCTNENRSVPDHSPVEKLTCYFFFISDCPASRNNLPKIQELSEKYARQVDFIGVVSDPYLDSIELNTTLKEFSVSFPIQLDTNLSIARAQGAKITPEVFLYDSKNKLIYSGSVNNYYYALGKHRKRISFHYLSDAIENSLAEKPINPARTVAFGCAINFTTKK